MNPSHTYMVPNPTNPNIMDCYYNGKLFQKPIMTFEDLETMDQTKKKFRTNYARCHCLPLKLLKQRCMNYGVAFDPSPVNDNFMLTHDINCCKFVRNKETNTYFVSYKKQSDTLYTKSNIEVTNEHLLGLYNPLLLFDLFDCLISLSLFLPSIAIEKNELVIPDQNLVKSNLILNSNFQKLVEALDSLSKDLVFKIQLIPNYFVINRVLKVSVEVLCETLSKNVLQILIKLGQFYFNCFSVAPVCCRMQSVNLTAVFDFEKFSYYHLTEKYVNEYLQISKLLYHFISDVNPNFLKKNYLEIIPTTLVNIKKPSKILNTLNELHFHGIAVTSLSSGNFRLSKYFDVSAEMLFNIIDTEQLKSSFDKLNFLLVHNNVNLIMQEELIVYNPVTYFEYDQVINRTGDTFCVKNVPGHLQTCYHTVKNIEKLLVLTAMTYPVFMLKYASVEVTHPLQIIAEKIQQCLCPKVQRLCSNTEINSMLKSCENDKAIREDCFYFKPNDIFAEINRPYFPEETEIEMLKNKIKDFEEKEGIVLSIIEEKLETIEHFNVCLLEVYQKNDKSLLDFLYYSKNDLVIFLEKINNVGLNGLTFKVTNYQSIIFNNYCEIRPSIFLKAKNITLLLDIIKYFCGIMKGEVKLNGILGAPNRPPLTPEVISTMQLLIRKNNCDPFVSAATELGDDTFYDAETFRSRLATKKVAIRIAKLLNPVLSEVAEHFFDSKAFLCIPQPIFYNGMADSFLEMMNETRLRKFTLNIFFCSQNYYIRFDEFAFALRYFHVMRRSSLIETFLKLLENISADLEGFLVIRDVFVDEVKNYKRLEEDNYGYQYNSKVLTGTENYVYVKKCLDIIEKHNLLTRVLVNGNLLVNSTVYITSLLLCKIKNEYQIEFQKAVNTLTLIIRDVIALPDHWISMEKEASENPFKRVGGFSIIDNKENDYLNLAKVIQPAIESIGMSDDVILSYKYLELLPKNLLLDLEDVKKLKDVFGELRKTEYSITVAENGNIGYGCIQLPVGKWLDVTTPKYLTEVVAYFTEVNMNNSMQPFILQCSGLISPFDSAETTNLEFSNQVTETQIQLKEVIEKFSSELKSNNSKLSLTINSARHIMFGTYLWVPFNVIEGIKDHIIKIVTAFEKTFEKTDGQDQGLCALNSEEASMQSIENLETQYLALMLARKLNVVLHRDLDAFMSDGTLKVFPTPLYNEWKKTPNETFVRYFRSLEALEENKMTWFLQFNGNIQIGKFITLKLKQLPEIENFNELKSLVEMEKELLTKKEVKYFLNKDERVYKTKIPSHEDIVKARKIADSFAKEKNHIEQNGTLLYRKLIWVRPDDFLSEKEDIIEAICQKLITVFKKNTKIRFQYGRPKLAILTSMFLTSEEKFFQYCCIFCAFVQERDKNITIKYYPERNQFKFNDIIFIHPRSFFHLQDINAFVIALQNYSSNKINDDVAREEQFIKDYINGANELQNIQKAERLEFDPMRKNCFKKLEEIFKLPENINFISTFLPNFKNHLDKNNSHEYGIQNIKIHNNFVFQSGVTNILMEIKKGTNNALTCNLKFREKIILAALYVAHCLPNSVKNLFDFASVVECVNEYCRGKRVDGHCLFHSQENRVNDNEILNNLDSMINFFKEQLNEIKTYQTNGYEYVFSTIPKGLHHWLKHGEYFESLKDYYEVMNQFFKKNKKYEKEFDVQNGFVLTREYTENIGNGNVFLGSLIVDPETDKRLSVATFYYKTVKPYLKYDANVFCPQNLIFTAKFFRKDENFKICDNIMVNLFKGINSFDKELKTVLVEEQNVKKVLVFLTESANQKQFNKVLNSLFQKFTQLESVIWYSKDIHNLRSNVNRTNIKEIAGIQHASWCNHEYKNFIENNFK